MEVIVQHLGGAKFEVDARGHRLLCDQPESNRGEDTGMTPPEFLLASLGTCAGYYAAEYLRFRNLPAERLTVRVSAEKAADPTRLGKFRIEVEAPGVTEAKHNEGILRSVKKCLIHATLLHPPEIEIEIHTSATSEVLV
jgi:putative redox protein